MLPAILADKATPAAIEAWDPSAILDGALERGEITLTIAPERIAAAARFLKDRQQYERLSSITCADWLPREPRFAVVYHFHSIARNERLRLVSWLPGEAPEIDSISSVYRAADWYEREVYDMFGVAFRNHPNLTRILMPEGWNGHPLRKDYPVHGHKYDYKDSL